MYFDGNLVGKYIYRYYHYFQNIMYIYILLFIYICIHSVYLYVPKQLLVMNIWFQQRGPAGHFFRLLPGDELRVGPVVGRRATHDGSLVFDGMDDWLGELYEGHKPRSFTGALQVQHVVQKDRLGLCLFEVFLFMDSAMGTSPLHHHLANMVCFCSIYLK